MTEKKDLPRRKAVLRGGSTTPTVMVRPGDAVYQGEVSTAMESLRASEPGGKLKVRRNLKKYGLTMPQLRFMAAMAGGATATTAYMYVFPQTDPARAGYRATQMKAGILRKIGKEDFYDHLGLGADRLARVAREATDAKLVKVFINTKTGGLVESREYVDHSTRLAGARFAAELSGAIKSKESEGGGPIQVNIVNYVRPGEGPWPGGGRS